MCRVCVFRRFRLCFMTSLVAAAAMVSSLAFAQAAGSPAPRSHRTNAFNDPFVQVTSAIPQCPVPEGPLYTEAEVRELAHVRSQHGGSCHRVGRCRLPNSYLYDAEIIPRVLRYIQQDGCFDDTSVWVLGERRLVTRKGCVQSQAQSARWRRPCGWWTM